MTHTIQGPIKDFIMSEFLPGEDPDELTGDTPLISGGILDSIATLKLVMFMEERFGITFEAHEVNRELLDTLADIARLVASKNPKLRRESA
jgi:acyl carrier protein